MNKFIKNRISELEREVSELNKEIQNALIRKDRAEANELKEIRNEYFIKEINANKFRLVYKRNKCQ